MKLIIRATLFLGIMISVLACGKTSEQSPGQTNTGAVASKTGQDSSIEQVLGTYVGIHGSGLVLRDDGSAEYYWKEWPSVESVTWKYENNTVIVSSNNIGYDFYAEVPDGTVTSLLFKADSKSWTDENFVKTSDETKHLSKDDFVSLIEATLNIKLDTQQNGATNGGNGYSETIEVGKLTLNIPDYYVHTGETYTASEGNSVAVLKFESQAIDRPDFDELTPEQLDTVLSDTVDKMFNTYLSALDLNNTKKTGSSLFEHDGYYIKRTEGEGIYVDEKTGEKADAKFINYFVYDGEFVSCLMCLCTPKQGPKYERDFDNMIKESINSAPIVEKEQTKENSDSKEAASGSKSAVIEAIDSYEAFIDEYIELMQEVKNSPSDLTLLSKYSEYMTKYTDLAEKFEALDDQEMTKEEEKYYIDASARISKKLIDAAY